MMMMMMMQIFVPSKPSLVPGTSEIVAIDMSIFVDFLFWSVNKKFAHWWWHCLPLMSLLQVSAQGVRVKRLFYLHCLVPKVSELFMTKTGDIVINHNWGEFCYNEQGPNSPGANGSVFLLISYSVLLASTSPPNKKHYYITLFLSHHNMGHMFNGLQTYIWAVGVEEAWGLILGMCLCGNFTCSCHPPGLNYWYDDAYFYKKWHYQIFFQK